MQRVHPEALCTEYIPAGQIRQSDPPAEGWLVPAEHKLHVAEDEAPVSAEYLPAGQAEQVLAPVPEKKPAEQLMQNDADDEPLLSEYKPGAQLTQVTDSDQSANVPGAHCVQVDAVVLEEMP